MKQNQKILMIIGICFLFQIFAIGDVYAADVLETVRNKAAEFIYNLRALIFIIAGFGLIGFTFGAIFGKISWKWFANIAIGLFLVANVGLFIDYFASKSGNAGTYKELGYGEYLNDDGTYSATNGSNSTPQSQKTQNNSSETSVENNNSNDINSSCVPGTGINCGESSSSSTSQGNTSGGNETSLTVDQIANALNKQNGNNSTSDSTTIGNADSAGGQGDSLNSTSSTENSSTIGNADSAGAQGDDLSNAPSLSVDQIANAMNKLNGSENSASTSTASGDNGYDIDGGELQEVVIEAPNLSNAPSLSVDQIANAMNNGNNTSTLGNKTNNNQKKAEDYDLSDGKVVINGQEYTYDKNKGKVTNTSTGESFNSQQLKDEMSAKNCPPGQEYKGTTSAGPICKPIAEAANDSPQTVDSAQAEEQKNENQIEKLKAQYKAEYEQKIAPYRNEYDQEVKKCQETRDSCQKAILDSPSIADWQKVDLVNSTCAKEQAKCNANALDKRNEKLSVAYDEYRNKVLSLSK